MAISPSCCNIGYIKWRWNTDSTKLCQGNLDSSRRSSLKWKKVAKLGFNTWLLWEEKLIEILCQSDTGHSLRKTLGEWLHFEYGECDWYCNAEKTELLYHVQERHALQYRIIRERRSLTRRNLIWYKAEKIHKQPISTSDLMQANVYKESKGIRLVSFHGARGKKEQSEKEDNARTHATSLDKIIQYSEVYLPPIHMSNLSTITPMILDHMMQNEVRIVADGSFKDRKSTYCMIIQSMDMKYQIVLTGSVPENSEEDERNTDPYRSELMGLYMGLLVQLIIEKHTQTSTKVILFSDNDNALDTTGIHTRFFMETTTF